MMHMTHIAVLVSLAIAGAALCRVAWRKLPLGRRSLTAALVVTVPALSLTLVAIPASAAPGITCRSITASVALRPGNKRTSTVWGQLCGPASKQPTTVQLLLHGATYTHTYWDWSYQPGVYSYVRRIVPAGYATLAVDRIGHGHSSHPISALVDTNSNAYVTHQLVQGLRDGTIGRFAKVVTVGHSYGSLTALQEAGQWHDVSATILTGILHRVSPPALLNLVASFGPADLESPRFAALDPGYLTTRPGTRAAIFYNSDAADPKVISQDEAAKDTITATEFASFAQPLLNGSAAKVRVPVLVVIGEKDELFCGAGGSDCSSADTVQTQEAQFFRPMCLHSYVLARAGHDVNLHPGASNWYAAARSWTDRYVGTGLTAPVAC